MSENGAVVGEAVERLRENVASMVLTGLGLTARDVLPLCDELKENGLLKTLNLEENALGAEGAQELAASLAMNQGLETLLLGSNKIGDGGCEALMEMLKQNSWLVMVGLDKNKLTSASAESIASALELNRTLHVLELQDNDLGDSGSRKIAGALISNDCLLELNLSNNNVMSKGAEKLARAVRGSGSIQSLILRENEIGDPGTKAIADALKSNSSLHTLDITDNDIGDDGAQAIGTALTENNTLLTLILGKNGIDVTGMRNLANGLKQNATLHVLNLDGNEIADSGVRALGSALTQNKSLHELHLTRNEISYSGAQALTDALWENKSLKYLNLEGNRIGPKGAAALAAVLERNNNLRVLVLAETGLGAKGAASIGEALKKNHCLRTLVIDKNSIGDAGADALAKALSRNTTLHVLTLANNKIGDEGAQSLGGSLLNNNSLQQLDLSSNNIGDDGAQSLATGLHGNECLRALELSRGSISKELLAQLDGRIRLINTQVSVFARRGVEALQKNAKVRWGRAKLMAVGKAAAGKTSFVKALLGEPVAENPGSTIGVDLSLTRTRDWQLRRADAGDLAEQLAKHEYRPQMMLQRMSKRITSAYAASRESVKRTTNAAGNRNSTRNSLRRPSPQPSIIVQVEEDEIAMQYSAMLKMEVQKKGASMDEEITFAIWDFGGQHVFYGLHQLFLTSNGVYTVVFDLRELVNADKLTLKKKERLELDDIEEATAQMRFWFNSINIHAPRANIALIGTHLDALPAEMLKEVDSELVNRLKVDKLKSIVFNPQDELHFFPVNNLERSDTTKIEQIREALTEAVKTREFVTKMVPLRWTWALEKMLADSSRDYMTLDSVKTLAVSECGIDPEEVDGQGLKDKLLPFLHEVGTIVHLKSSPVLENLVVTRPQWLIDNLSRVICSPQHMEEHKKKLFFGTGTYRVDKLPKDLLEDLELWEVNAIASRRLLEWLWTGENVDYFIDLMEHMLLANPVRENSSDLLIPSLLATIPTARKLQLQSEFQNGANCVIHFDLLPRGVFERFICLLLEDDLLNLRDIFGDCVVAKTALDGEEIFILEDAEQKLVKVQLKSIEDKQTMKVAQDTARSLGGLFRDVDERFMKAKLKPRIPK